MEDTLVSRKQALKLGLSQYFTGKPCTNGHVSKRSTSSRKCLECHRLSMTLKRSSDPLAHQEYLADYAARRGHVKKDYAKRYYEANRETRLLKNKEWRDANKERRKEYNKRFRESDKGRAILNAHHMKRHASKIQATPVWANFEKIEELYVTARLISQKIGVETHVDHYYPLQGRLVCGLHVHENLRVITKAENKAKKNKHPEDWEREKLEKGLSYPSLEDSLE